jgi:hypothetical protein
VLDSRELVDDGEPRLVAARHLTARDVFTVHHDTRGARHAIAADEIFGALELCVYGERVERIGERLCVDAVLREEGGNLAFAV